MLRESTKTGAHRLYLACLALSLIAFSTGSAFAQYRGSLQGTVTDPSGATVPGATVTLTSNETSVAKNATTNNDGVYTFPGLAPGMYSVKVEKTGFNPVATIVQLVSEQPQSQNVQLQVGTPTSQTVTVNASEGPVLETETATVSTTISSRQLQALPTFGRDPFQVAQLASGTFGDNARGSSGSGASNLPGSAGPGATSGTSSIFATENQVQISSNGTRNASNDFQVDGSSVNSLAWGGAAVITPNKESVKEVTVQSNPYSAENGRNAGAQVLVVSKNGTNDFHGSALMKFDRPGLNAYQRWGGPNDAPPQRDNDRFNQWAGSLGGPIVKNRLFFFFSYETLRNESSTTATGWYETPQYLNLVKTVNPSYIAGKTAAYPGEGVSYNLIVPKSCADAGLTVPGTCAPVFNGGQYAGLDIGSPLTSARGTQDPTYVSNGQPGIGNGLDGVPDIMFVQSVSPFSTTPQQYQGRADFQATSKDLIAFTSFLVPVSTTSYNGGARAANLWHNDRQNETAALLWTHTISSSWLNEARFNVTRWSWNEINSNPQAPFGLPQSITDSLGNASLNALGAPGPSAFAQTQYNFRDTVSTVIRSHSLKMGLDYLKEQDGDSAAWSGRPSYNFRNLWDYANDAPYQESGTFDPRTGNPTSATKYIRSTIWAGFLQDDWKVRPNLTLNLGLRWEYFSPVHEKYNNLSNVLLGDDPSNPLLGLRLKVGGDLYNASKNNWGPQVGFAWTPAQNGKLVLRGGFGIGYNRMQEAITLNGRSNPPLVAGFTFSGSDILYQVPSNVLSFNGYPANPRAVLGFSPTTGLPISGAPVDLQGFPNNLATPLSYRDSLEMQYDVGGNWVAKLGYQGSLSRHLTRQNNLNWIYSPLNPQVRNLNFYSNDANGNYNALLAEMQHRFAKNFELDFQYRWSKTIDDGSNDYFISEYPYALPYLKGPADFDVRHNVKLYGVYTPHIFRAGSWEDKIFGNWQISGILNWHSGYPWTPEYSNTGCNLIYQGSGYCSLRPAAAIAPYGMDYSNAAFQANGPGGTLPAGGNYPNGALSYFTVPGFVQGPAFPANGPIPQAPGVGRNVLRGPGYFDTDATLQKSFGLPKLPIFGENARFELRGDLFNIFNKLNLDTSTIGRNISNDGIVSNATFGQAQGALAGRIVELQARFSF